MICKIIENGDIALLGILLKHALMKTVFCDTEQVRLQVEQRFIFVGNIGMKHTKQLP